MEAVRRTPEMCPVVVENYRRFLLRRFPYAIFYAHAGESVIVYGVFHASRDPRKWRRRLP